MTSSLSDMAWEHFNNHWILSLGAYTFLSATVKFRGLFLHYLRELLSAVIQKRNTEQWDDILKEAFLKSWI